MTIYDSFGRPIDTGVLTKEQSGHVDMVRPLWHDPVADRLRPARLAALITAAKQGEANELLTLAEEMEEREMHYASVIGTRKLAVSGLEPQIAGQDDLDEKIVDACQQLIETPEFVDLVSDLMDAVAKGYSICEIMWDRGGKSWMPADFRWRDPRWFRHDMDDGEKLKLITEDHPVTGELLAPYKYIVHYPRIKQGLKVVSGLARLASVSYMCKAYALRDWMQFLAIYGMPIRIGKYGAGASPADIATLRKAVINIGSDAAAVMPESMKIEFVESSGSAKADSSVFRDLADWVDSQTSKGVLGQTMTTDDGSSRSQAEVHDEVRQDIKADDARKLANTINSDLIRPFVDLNFGPQKAYPRVYFPIEETQDIKDLAEALQKLVPLGFRVSQSWVRSRVGSPEPQDDEDVLHPASGSTPQPAVAPSDPEPQKARNSEERPDDEEDELDRIAQEELADWQPMMKPILDPVQRLLSDVDNYDDFRRRLPELMELMDETEFAERLARAAFKARGLGDATDAQ